MERTDQENAVISELADWLQGMGTTMWSTFSPLYERETAIQAATWFHDQMQAAFQWHINSTGGTSHG